MSFSMDFRVRLIPTPVATVGGKSGGSIEKNDLLSQIGIVANLGDFLLDLRYFVMEFKVEVRTPEGTLLTARSNSATFTDSQKTLIRNLNTGQRVLISNIKARGPDGREVFLNDMFFTIN